MRVEDVYREQVRDLFFEGYESGLEQRELPNSDDSEYFWHGWAMGHVEAEGWLRKVTLREKIQKFFRWRIREIEQWLKNRKVESAWEC